jgi:hypothetical protein
MRKLVFDDLSSQYTFKKANMSDKQPLLKKFNKRSRGDDDGDDDNGNNERHSANTYDKK